MNRMGTRATWKVILLATMVISELTLGHSLFIDKAYAQEAGSSSVHDRMLNDMNKLQEQVEGAIAVKIAAICKYAIAPNTNPEVEMPKCIRTGVLPPDGRAVTGSPIFYTRRVWQDELDKYYQLQRDPEKTSSLADNIISQAVILKVHPPEWLEANYSDLARIAFAEPIYWCIHRDSQHRLAIECTYPMNP